MLNETTTPTAQGATKELEKAQRAYKSARDDREYQQERIDSLEKRLKSAETEKETLYLKERIALAEAALDVAKKDVAELRAFLNAHFSQTNS